MKLFFSLTLFAAFLLCPSACADGVREGLLLAAHSALPALFPFFLASGLLVRSGLAEALGRIVARPLAVLYGLPPESAPAVVLGLAGGYPVGAATVTDLLRTEQISDKTAVRINAFCNCASPGFCVGLVGLGVFGSARTGALLYGIHAVAALITGLLVARGPLPQPRPCAIRTDTKKESFSASFCSATQQAASTALTVTAFLTVFSVLLHLLAPFLRALPYGDMLIGTIELTNGLDKLPLLPLPIGAQLTLASFLLGFGGLAVQFQVRALTAPYALPMTTFTLGKLLHGTIAALLTALLFEASPQALTAFAPAVHSTVYAHNAIGLAGLIVFLSVIWDWKKN